MKKISLVKIIVALLISNVYIFSCAVTGTVGNSETAGSSDADNSAADENAVINPVGTVDFIFDNNSVAEETSDNSTTSTVVVENLSFAKPSITNKVVTSNYNPTSSVIKLAEQGTSSSVESEESSSSNESVPDIVDSYVPPVSKPEPVSTPNEPEVPVTSNTEPEEEPNNPASSDEPDTPNEPTPPDDPNTTPATPPEQPNSGNYDSNETLRVNNNGTEVSGSAVDIITQIVENEIGSSFAPEAIKAQAVTAYTYVKYSNLHGSTPYCILKESRNDSVRTLVQSVIGQGIYYDGELIQAVYSASSAGWTASSKNVWGGDLPYLQSVYCELDKDYDPNYGLKKTFTEEEMKSKVLNNANIALSGDPAEWFKIVNYIEGKYVGDMTIGGQESFVDNDGETRKITGRRFREIIMDYSIRSSAFDIEYDPDMREFTVTTYGYGHGVGLSQNGAQNLATQWGWDYKQILTFYFQGTEVY